MNSADLFARHYAHLVSLLLREPGNIDAQKSALRAAVAAARGTAANVAVIGDAVRANGEMVDTIHSGISDLVAQMRFHGLAMLAVDAGASPAHLLAVARILVGMPTLDDGGAAAEAQRIAAGATSVRFAARPRITSEMNVIGTPAAGASVVPPAMAGALPDLEFGDVLDDPLGAALARATPRFTQQIPERPRDDDGMSSHFSASAAPSGTPEVLLQALGKCSDPRELAKLLDGLVIHATAAAKGHKPVLVCEILSRIARREQSLTDVEARRACQFSLRKLATPEVLRAVTAQLAADPGRREECLAILTHAGEAGADALIEQIGAIPHRGDRRGHYEALRQLRSGVPALLHLLGDSRWFAVRNAAEILGEMQVKEAEQPLTELRRHEDERVRRAARSALMRLGTFKAMQAIEAGLGDQSPDVRSDAAAALVMRRDPRSTQLILSALDAEKDEQVQSAFLLNLGKLGTPAAVERLIHSAEPERGLFKKKAAAFRVAAVYGLAEVRTSEATNALRALLTDKDDEVREAARLALGRVSKAVPAL
jgi:HEAT repeat protein